MVGLLPILCMKYRTETSELVGCQRGCIATNARNASSLLTIRLPGQQRKYFRDCSSRPFRIFNLFCLKEKKYFPTALNKHTWLFRFHQDKESWTGILVQPFIKSFFFFLGWSEHKAKYVRKILKENILYCQLTTLWQS